MSYKLSIPEPESRRFWGVPTQELQLDLSWLRQTMRDVSEDDTLAESTRRNSIDYLNYRAAPIVAELTRRKEQLLRFKDTSLADPWPDAGSHNTLMKRARDLKERVSLSEYVRLVFPASDLHRNGRNTWVGHCLFPGHPDSDPSFNVFDDRRYTCFGCGEQGDVYHLVALADGLERFADQVDALARWAEKGGSR